MFGPQKIMKWCDDNLQGMRRSRRTTLASICAGAMKLRGVGVLALGRSMDGPVSAKHCIKRVDRFLGNERFEADALCTTLFHVLRGEDKCPVVLADWTDRKAFEQLVFSITKDGRSMPFYSVTIDSTRFKAETTGVKIRAEREALARLHAMCPGDVRPVIIADRGFGNARWIGDVQKWGWHFVQRLSKAHYVEVQQHIGTLPELGIRRGHRAKDWGWGVMGENEQEGKTRFRLVSVYSRDADEPWYLIANIEDCDAEGIVKLYKKRVWTEAMFRDLKSRKWGMGLDEVQLSTAQRTQRHFMIIMLAYVLLCAFGAIAEHQQFGERLKANTVDRRVLSLAVIGNHFIEFIGRITVRMAMEKLVQLPT